MAYVRYAELDRLERRHHRVGKAPIQVVYENDYPIDLRQRRYELSNSARNSVNDCRLSSKSEGFRAFMIL